jgi:hypothetical protein
VGWEGRRAVHIRIISSYREHLEVQQILTFWTAHRGARLGL